MKLSNLTQAILSWAILLAICTGAGITVGCAKGEASGRVAALADRVAEWQTKNFTYAGDGSAGMLHDHGLDAWTNGTFFIGLSQWADMSPGGDRYLDWLYDMGEKNDWKIPANFAGTRYSLHHADEICVGQFYLAMYERYGEEKMLGPIKQRIDWIMANPPDPNLSIRNKQSWTWCDALFMAPPVYVMLDKIFPQAGYMQYMDAEFQRTAGYLYDPHAGLFYRDDSYFGKQEANGEKVFWGRGNGWVIAGLSNILKIMPADSEYRPYYEDKLTALARRLARLQSPDGFWHASLLDPGSYPMPETSATALIAYGIAFGINNGLLPAKEYAPVLRKAWSAIETIVDADGRPGYVQPIGADPKKVTGEMTAVYGSGAILMAAAEITDLLDKNAIVRRTFARNVK